MVRDDLSKLIGQGNKNSCPQFGYPQMNFAPDENMLDYDETLVAQVNLGPSRKIGQNRKVYLKKQKYINTESNKVYIDSMWEPLTNAILSSARKGRQLNIAKSMESHENHDVILEEVMRRFSSTTKLSKEELINSLKDDYNKRLDNKIRMKFNQIKFEKEIEHPPPKKNEYSPQKFLRKTVSNFNRFQTI